MALLIWTEKNDLGIRDIDAHHRIMCSLINDLGESIGKDDEAEAVERALYTLHSYTGFHFDAEEKLMKKFGYPLLKDHQKLHAKYIEEVGLLKRKHTASPGGLGREVFQFIKDWFFKHCQGEDRKYSVFFEKEGALVEIEADDEQETTSGKKLKEGFAQFIVWQEKYNLGIEQIDEQHRAWADSINILHSSIGQNATSEMVKAALNGLKDYTHKHFRYEEEILAKIKYPKLQDQKDEHAKFKAEVDNLALKFEKYNTVVDFEHILYMKNWFLKHIRGTDNEYASFFENKE